MVTASKHDPEAEGAGGARFKQLSSTGAACQSSCACEALPKGPAEDSQAAKLRVSTSRAASTPQVLGSENMTDKFIPSPTRPSLPDSSKLLTFHSTSWRQLLVASTAHPPEAPSWPLIRDFMTWLKWHFAPSPRAPALCRDPVSLPELLAARQNGSSCVSRCFSQSYAAQETSPTRKEQEAELQPGTALPRPLTPSAPKGLFAGNNHEPITCRTCS